MRQSAIILLICLLGCSKGDDTSRAGDTYTDGASPSVSAINIAGGSLYLSGSNLDKVTKVRLGGSSISRNLNVLEHSQSALRAVLTEGVLLIKNSVYSVFVSTANAEIQATFSISVGITSCSAGWTLLQAGGQRGYPFCIQNVAVTSSSGGSYMQQNCLRQGASLCYYNEWGVGYASGVFTPNAGDKEILAGFDSLGGTATSVIPGQAPEVNAPYGSSTGDYGTFSSLSGNTFVVRCCKR